MFSTENTKIDKSVVPSLLSKNNYLNLGNVPLTLNIAKKVIISLNFLKLPDPDCAVVVVLKDCKP